jgi:hypothetical protein
MKKFCKIFRNNWMNFCLHRLIIIILVFIFVFCRCFQFSQFFYKLAFFWELNGKEFLRFPSLKGKFGTKLYTVFCIFSTHRHLMQRRLYGLYVTWKVIFSFKITLKLVIYLCSIQYCHCIIRFWIHFSN